MTNHKLEDVEALIDAFDRYELHRNDSLSIGSYDRLKAAREKLAPKPAKVYVLPEWFTKTKEQFTWCQEANIIKDEWDQLRELTATEASAQKWNMPTLQQINEICGQPYGAAPTNALDTWYEAIRNKIMAMND